MASTFSFCDVVPLRDGLEQKNDKRKKEFISVCRGSTQRSIAHGSCTVF